MMFEAVLKKGGKITKNKGNDEMHSILEKVDSMIKKEIKD